MSGGRDTGTDANRMSKEIGELLLQGWRMIDQACPVTGAVPLMQHPVNQRKFSVAVGKYTDELGSTEAEAAPMAVESTEDTPTNVGQIQSTAAHFGAATGASLSAPPVGWAGAHDGVEPPATSEPDRPSRRDDDDAWCKTMGDLMLQGWTMLAEHCPATGAVPLMQHPRSRRKFSVATGRYIDEAPAAMIGNADEPEPLPCPRSSQGLAPVTVSTEADNLSTRRGTAAASANAAHGAQTTGTNVSAAPTSGSLMGAASMLAPASEDAAHAATFSAIHRARLAVVAQMDACTNALQQAEVPPPLNLLEAIGKCADAIFALDRVAAGPVRCT